MPSSPIPPSACAAACRTNTSASLSARPSAADSAFRNPSDPAAASRTRAELSRSASASARAPSPADRLRNATAAAARSPSGCSLTARDRPEPATSPSAAASVMRPRATCANAPSRPFTGTASRRSSASIAPSRTCRLTSSSSGSIWAACPRSFQRASISMAVRRTPGSALPSSAISIACWSPSTPVRALSSARVTQRAKPSSDTCVRTPIGIHSSCHSAAAAASRTGATASPSSPINGSIARSSSDRPSASAAPWRISACASVSRSIRYRVSFRPGFARASAAANCTSTSGSDSAAPYSAPTASLSHMTPSASAAPTRTWANASSVSSALSRGSTFRLASV